MSAAATVPRKRFRPSISWSVRIGDLAADRVAEVGRRAQRPLDPGRRDVDRVPVEVAAQQVGDALAERVVDTGRVVDVDREPLRAGQLDGEHLDARKALLHGLRNLSRQLSLLLVNLRQKDLLHKKWAPRAHFAKPVKCGEERIATAPGIGVPPSPRRGF